MRLPINPIARFLLNKVVLPAIGRAVADGKNPLTKDAAKEALTRAVQAEVSKRVGSAY